MSKIFPMRNRLTWDIAQGKEIFYLYYMEEDNMFVDCDGYIIYDLFTLITPQDLFLFRHDNFNNKFPMVGESDVVCEIIPIPDELQLIFEAELNYCFDPGDDYERIDRYERARSMGCFNRGGEP